MKVAGRVLKYYSRVIAECIPLFVAAGLFSAFASGSLQNTYLYEISNVLSYLVIPVFMGYKSGNMCGGEAGGIAGTLTASAVVMTEPGSAMVLSAIAGSLAGFFCKKGMDWLKTKIPSGFEMLFSNLYLAGIGLISGVLTYFLLVPAAAWVIDGLSGGLSVLLAKGLIPFISFVVEPLKIIFFNNWINHGFFLPLGLEQVKAGGSSLLFLLETNPGPGFGLLLAFALMQEDIRKKMISSLIIQSLGGIHEVYFPYVLSNLRLLPALIAGGLAGNYYFMVSGTGLLGPASPGSLITILIMADKRKVLSLIIGILISAAITCILCCLILAGSKAKPAVEEPEQKEDEEITMKKTERIHIYFVCDVGMGSSVMASALFRRKLKSEGLEYIEVSHASADRIPDDATAIVCQEDFSKTLTEVKKRCFTVENLMDMSCYQELLEWLKGDV